MDAETKAKLMDAHSSLHVACLQSISTDDQIIMGRVREALLVLDDVLGIDIGAKMLEQKRERDSEAI